MCIMSDKCGACRRKVCEGVNCIQCNIWFHWDCANTNAENVNSQWKWKYCKQLDIVKEQAENITHLRRQLELANEEFAALKSIKPKVRSKSPDFKVVSNQKRKGKNSSVPSTATATSSTEVELSNRFSVLDSLEPESHAPSNSVSEPKRRKNVLLLGSSHGRAISQRLQASLGEKYAVTSFFKPNASLSNVVGDLSALAKDLDKEDHVIIVGGAGNSLDRNLNYSIDGDIHNIAQKSGHTNVGFVNLFQRHDKPWMNRRVESVNLRIDLAQLERDMAHINIIDKSSIVREEYINHGLHLNSRGKDSLTRLIADSLQCDHGKCDNKIPVVIRHRACPFLE
ncbi:uncharacterized protein [Periplaneta americana]|uniref:uncharacterized protein n=1 Tax=Periplaneta americana TaxID=6978 RepID=UPI0037E8175D